MFDFVFWGQICGHMCSPSALPQSRASYDIPRRMGGPQSAEGGSPYSVRTDLCLRPGRVG